MSAMKNDNNGKDRQITTKNKAVQKCGNHIQFRSLNPLIVFIFVCVHNRTK